MIIPDKYVYIYYDYIIYEFIYNYTYMYIRISFRCNSISVYVYIYISLYILYLKPSNKRQISLSLSVYIYVDFASMPSVCPCMSITCVMPIRLSLPFQGLPMQRLSFRARYSTYWLKGHGLQEKVESPGGAIWEESLTDWGQSLVILGYNISWHQPLEVLRTRQVGVLEWDWSRQSHW